MSNVLIGLFGVVLFIGLALAGALVLGSDFRSSRESTAAAALGQQLQQIAAAINMYQLKTGRTLISQNYSTNMATLTPRFLKALPINGYNRPQPFLTLDRLGQSSSMPVGMVYTLIGSGEAARNVCRTIEEQAGAADPEDNIRPQDVATVMATRPRVGCWSREDYDDEDNMVPYYYAFIPV